MSKRNESLVALIKDFASGSDKRVGISFTDDEYLSTSHALVATRRYIKSLGLTEDVVAYKAGYDKVRRLGTIYLYRVYH